MRKFLTGAALSILATFAVHARADDVDHSDVLADAALDESSDASLEIQGYNIWVCAAVKRGSIGYGAPIYFGASQPFPQGSGQGQQARYYALQQALNNCGGGLYCIADCQVQRFSL